MTEKIIGNSRAPVTDEELEQWAAVRADDAGHLARELITYRRSAASALFANPRKVEAVAVVNVGLDGSVRWPSGDLVAVVAPSQSAPPCERNRRMSREDIINYALRYGGMCRDCADTDGVCSSGLPCDSDVRRRIIKHALDAWTYGIKHGFIDNPFSALSAPAPSIDAEAVEEAVYETAWEAFRDSDKPAPYNQVKDAVNAALAALALPAAEVGLAQMVLDFFAAAREQGLWVGAGRDGNRPFTDEDQYGPKTKALLSAAVALAAPSQAREA